MGSGAHFAKKYLKHVLNRMGLDVRRYRPPVMSEPELYDAASFSGREFLRANYNQLGDALSSHLDFQTVLDVGSANGFLIDAFVSQGKEIRGIEVAESVRPYLSPIARERTIFGDATLLADMGQFDLVTCIEVAEHISPEKSSALLDFITISARRWVYFTAATPYQKGKGHINCRPTFFWLNEFRKRGLELDFDRTERLVDTIRDMLPAKWIPLNSLVLKVVHSRKDN